MADRNRGDDRPSAVVGFSTAAGFGDAFGGGANSI